MAPRAGEAEGRVDTDVMAEEARKLFARWAEEEAGGMYDDEPSWEEIKKALDEERGDDADDRFPNRK